MTKGQETNSVPPMFADPRVLAWMEQHVGELRQTVSGQRLLYQSLVAGFVVGLAAHIGGYLLRASTPGEPFGLLADLLYALGLALWTGVAVAMFVQVIPEVKRRQFKQTLEAYDAFQRDKAQSDDKREGG